MRRRAIREMLTKGRQFRGLVYCLICTHTVEADIVQAGRKLLVRAGQACLRCSSLLDLGIARQAAAHVMAQRQAA
jgi:hypothetical protein